MAVYSDFKNLNSGANGTVEGHVSIEGSAEGFRYSKEIIARLPFKPGIIRDDFEIELVESDKPNARVLFHQRVNFGINVIAIEGGALTQFIAYPAENEQIETTIINGDPVESGAAVQFLDLGYKTEFGITADFQASPGSLGGGEITGTWVSPPYVLDFSEGAILRIKKDGWRPIGLSRIATYKTSYRAGSPRLAALCDEIGAVHTARAKGGAVVLSHRFVAPGGTLARRARLRGTDGATLREPSIGKDSTNRMWIGAYDGNTYRLYFSDDDGTQIEPLRFKMPGGTFMDINIWKNGEKSPDLLVRRAGGGLTPGFCSIAQRGSQILFRSSADGVTWSEARLVASRKRSEPYQIREVEATGELLIFNGRLDHVLRSLDGNTWTPKTV